MLVGEVMTPDPQRVTAEVPVSSARAMMVAAGVRHLPVVDAGGHIMGVLSDRDLLPAPPGARVDEVMTRDPETVFADTLAFEAAAVMIQRRFGSLPVIDAERRVIGMLTETDLLIEAYHALSRST
jgi:CBS domain-containing protein